MYKKEDKKSKRQPSGFDFCPKHNVFYNSCGCSWQKKKKVESEIEPIKENE